MKHDEPGEVLLDDSLDLDAALFELRCEVLRQRLAVDAWIDVFILARLNWKVAAREGDSRFHDAQHPRVMPRAGKPNVPLLVQQGLEKPANFIPSMHV